MASGDKTTSLRGRKITLKTGASVAFYPNAPQGGHGFRFVNAEGEETAFRLSLEAFAALRSLIDYDKPVSLVWRVVDAMEGCKNAD
jgi:hypothetical protein